MLPEKFALVANYIGGSYSVLPSKADGSLGEASDVVKPGGPAKFRQRGGCAAGAGTGRAEPHHPRPHDRFDPSGQYVVGDDAGRDRIFVWRPNTGYRQAEGSVGDHALAGSAPRHFGFRRRQDAVPDRRI
jgi:6-phosphogluconolactonase (cycloisomerase 2 family)